MSAEKYALWAEGIGRAFGRTVALKSASLWAAPGKVTTLFGLNGSGKSTLLRIAVGELRPDYGMVSFLGDVRERHSLPRLARRGLMFLPQDRLLCRKYTVGAHFRALGATHGFDGFNEAITASKVGSLLPRRCSSLSGGEVMKVCLALALARRPLVLVADEPLVGLTPIEQEALGSQLRMLAARGVAVVTSGHDVRMLLDISDVILWVVAGTTHHLGTPTEALSNQQFVREYLGSRWSDSSTRNTATDAWPDP